MLKAIWKCIEAIVIIWGFLSIVAIGLDAVGWLPYYDIYYKKKTAITPRTFFYPGQDIRLSAEFARPVDPNDIERIVWSLKDSAGKVYGNLPHLREVDITLLPDLAGTLNMNVRAKLFSEDEERHGSGSIHVVQRQPYRMLLRKDATFLLPAPLADFDAKTVQLYGGSTHWLAASDITQEADRLHLITEGRPFPTWDGKAYLRYRRTEAPAGAYQYVALTTLDREPQEVPRFSDQKK